MEGEGALAAVVLGRSWISSGEICNCSLQKAQAGVLSVVLVVICCGWSAFGGAGAGLG